MAWFVSNCQSKSGREELVRELKKLVDPLQNYICRYHLSMNKEGQEKIRGMRDMIGHLWGYKYK